MESFDADGVGFAEEGASKWCVVVLAEARCCSSGACPPSCAWCSEAAGSVDMASETLWSAARCFQGGRGVSQNGWVVSLGVSRTAFVGGLAALGSVGH